jgi:hypothetical protein
MDSYPGNAEAFSKFGQGVENQKIVFEGMLPLLAHGHRAWGTSCASKCRPCLENLCHLCCEDIL